MASYLPLSRGSDSPIPLSQKFTLPTKFRALTFFGTAAATGILFHLLLIGFGGSESRAIAPIVKEEWNPPPLEHYEAPHCPPPPAESGNATHPYIRPGLGTYVDTDEDVWPLSRVKTMVEGTKGYYGRDYSLGLGWNNMRYIIETGLEHARLLNRTLVLPSFVYARSCEFNITVCASFTVMVNRGDAIGWSEWRELPIEQQMGFRIPIDIMLDLSHLRSYQPVVTVSEYLQLHGLSPELEWSNGAWNKEVYHSSHPQPTLESIPNHMYDPSNVVRVDRLIPGPHDEVTSGPVYNVLKDALGSNQVMNMDVARGALQHKGLNSWKTPAEFEALVEKNGFAVLHTFAGALGMDYLKSVVEPFKQLAPRASLRGLVDDYDHVTADVLVLEGETHLNRKPGSLRFTTTEARDDFADLVLHGTRPIAPIRELAETLAARMLEINNGRMWMAGHMRRGDFVTLSWAMENKLIAHFNRIKSRLEAGAKKLEDMVHDRDAPPTTFDVPNVKPDTTFIGASTPLKGDKFYLATDERSPEGLEYIRNHGAILIGDLLTPEDRRVVGWPLLVTDVLAVLEQAIMSHGAYFYAHAMSSVAGGVVNMRAARGLDPRTTLID